MQSMHQPFSQSGVKLGGDITQCIMEPGTATLTQLHFSECLVCNGNFLYEPQAKFIGFKSCSCCGNSELFQTNLVDLGYMWLLFGCDERS